MSLKNGKNVKQTKITDTMGVKTKKPRASPKPKEDISLQEKPCEELKTRSIFPVTFDEFVDNTNVIEVIKDYIKDKYPTALKTYLTEPEIMSRAKNTYKVFYKRPQRRCVAPMKYVRITSDCDKNIEQRLFKIPEEYKHLCENEDTEHQSVKKSLKKQDSSPNKNIDSVSDKKISEEKILGLKSIISNFDANTKETNEKECNFPVSFETFKKLTLYNDVIDNICQSIKELEYELPISNISKEELFDNNKLLRSYYKTFYLQTDIRTIFPLKIKPCPGRLKDKLLKYPEITSEHEEPTVSNRDVLNANTKEHLNKKTKLEKRKEDKNMEKCSLALEIKAAKDNAVEKSLLHHQKQNMPKTLSPTPCRAQMKAKPLIFPNTIPYVDSGNDSTTSNENDEFVEGSANVTVMERINQKPTVSNRDVLNANTKEHLNKKKLGKRKEDKNMEKCSLALEIKATKDNAVEKSLLHHQKQNMPKTLSSTPCRAQMKAKDLQSPNKIFNLGSDSDSTNCDENEDDIINVPMVKPLDESKQRRLQLKSTHDDSKFVLKFQDFVENTNILDLLRNSSDSTDDDLVNLAFEYYIKFVTNSDNPNVELFKNLMIHASENLVNKFYTVYNQNKEDTFKQVRAVADMQEPEASKSTNKNNTFPISIAEFKKYTYYKEVLLQILKERAKGNEKLFSKLRNKLVWKKILRIYYRNFFLKPSIRKKYTLRLKEMPQSLKAKFMEMPTKLITVKKKKNCDKNHLQSDRESNYTYFNIYKPLSDEFLLMYISKKVPDVNKHPEILRRIKEKKQSELEIISVETIVPPNIENEITLDEQSPVIPEENMEIFNKLFDPIPLKCTLSYVLRFCFGPKQSVLRTMMHISFEDFCKFTNIYQLSNIYNDKLKLFKIYESTIKKDIWPLNLFMRISDIFLYLLLNDVKLDSSDLQNISPKFLHWSDLAVNTDFDKIVQDYFNKNGERIENDEQLQISRDSFYTRCWNDDNWIWQIPKITNNSIQENINVTKALSDEDTEQLTVEKENVKDSYISLEKYLNENSENHHHKELIETSFNITNRSLKITDMTSTIAQSANNDEACSVDVLLSSQTQSQEDLVCMSYKANTSNPNNTEIIKTINEKPSESIIPIIIISDDSDQMSCHLFEETAIDSVVSGGDHSLSERKSFANINNTEIIKDIEKLPDLSLNLNDDSVQIIEDASFSLVEISSDESSELKPSDCIAPQQTGISSQVIKNEIGTRNEDASISLIEIGSNESSELMSSYCIAPQLTGISSQVYKNEIGTICEVSKTKSDLNETIITTGENNNLKMVIIHHEAISNLLAKSEGDSLDLPKSSTDNADQITETEIKRKRKQNTYSSSTNKKLKTNKITDIVPQLTHEFRPLPLQIITKSTASENIEPSLSGTASPSQSNTVSEALSVDATVFNDTQLLRAVDQQNYNLVPNQVSDKMNKNVAIHSNADIASHMSSKNATAPPSVSSSNTNQSNKNESSKVNEPELQDTLYFFELRQFHFILNSTANHIAKYKLRSSDVGQNIVETVIQWKLRTKLYGDVLNDIFSHIEPNILQDVRTVLHDLKEYHFLINDYKSIRNSKLELRHKILFYFMYSKLSFCYCRLVYETRSHDALCISMQTYKSARTQSADSRSHCLLEAIKPSIQEKLKKLKQAIEEKKL